MAASFSEKHWKFIERASIFKDVFISGPLVAAYSWLIGVMGQHIPIVSTSGLYGIVMASLFALLLLLVIKKVQAKKARRARTQAGQTSRLDKVIAWWGWKWIIAAALFVGGAFAIETRPPLPLGVPLNRIELPIASFADMGKSNILGKSVILGALPRDGGNPSKISHKRFDRCQIVGPAVIHLFRPFELGQNQFRSGDMDFETMLLETRSRIIPGTNGQLLMILQAGAIAMVDCRFIQCTFEDISFVGTPEDIDLIRKEAGLLPKHK
jgi:hypothetical protein